MTDDKPALDDKLHWYKDAVIYELHIKAFRDGNGDGIGDFEGLLQKLDYLEDLGITTIWVLPFYPSPLRDDGYDIADYYNINPAYGNISQFKRFLKEAHERNLKVITELVINHTSDQHPWFQRARKAPKDSVERNYYVWSDDATKYKDVRIIFQDFEASNWTWDAEAKQYYWHRFFNHQPDLNYDSPKVQEEVFKVIDYWCKMGVDGFRLDAVPYLYEREGTNGENLPETHAFLKKLRKHVDDFYPGTVLLAEANMWPEDSASYFGDGDECHMNYHFPVMPRMFMALQMEDRYPITDIFDQTPAIPETCQWAIFLRNHDELTLEMVTDEERDYMYKVYAKDPKAKINLGIRHRLGPLMENNRRKIELLNCLLFSLSGTPVIYYGDEIGMGDNFYLGDRDGVRTPMQWSPDRNAGFSETNPQKLYLPVILDPEYHYESVNVETQRRNPSSLLWFMKRLIGMRKRYKAFGRGNMKFINSNNPKVLAFTRCYRDETMLVVVNLSRYSQPVELDLTIYKGFVPVEVFSQNHFPVIKEEAPYFFTLSSYAYDWYLLKNAGAHLLKEKSTLPLLAINRWKDILHNSELEELESVVLPQYLLSVPWFRGKDRIIQNVTITNEINFPIADQHVCILLIEVSYESGLPEIYQLPVTPVSEAFGGNIRDSHPEAIICRLRIAEEEAFLCDAHFTPSYQQAILYRMAKGQDIEMKNNEILFYNTKSFRRYVKEHSDIRSRLVAVDKNYTTITYDNALFLKMYRLVDRSINADIETSWYLSEKTQFKNIPAFKGVLRWQSGPYRVGLGMMQELVESHGDGRKYMLDRLNDYFEHLQSFNKEDQPFYDLHGSITSPVAFDKLPAELKNLLGIAVADGSHLLGVRTGEMHLALSMPTDNKDFAPESFSLHYQRSLYAGLISLVRTTYTNQSDNIKRLPDSVRPMVEDILSRREDMLNILKRIYTHKLDVIKTRIHGNFYLDEVLYTGKDVVILDFGGDPQKSYTERRIKRSPLRDVAGIIQSLHNVAFESLQMHHENTKGDLLKFNFYMDVWTHHVTGFFLNAYLNTVKDSKIIPQKKEDLGVLLQTYLLEKALFSLGDELKKRPEWAVVPARIIKSILG
ncbi:MAG TPA: maltose alpha-D-glucosyltransferase [Chitinophagaceae bacterium]